jgi:signal transduction histidine kinase
MNNSTENNLLNRLQSLNTLKQIPREELEWLVQNGKFEIYQPGLVISKGAPADQLWIILSGRMSLHVDSGAGPKVANTELISGSITGKVPYSRLKVIPGDFYADEKTEVITISGDHLTELIHKCPQFTALTVHIMIDRTRIYNTSAMQDEKLISMGKMAAGLAHELNNPASVVMRNIKRLRQCQNDAKNASYTLLAAGVSEGQFTLLRDFHTKYIDNFSTNSMTALQKSDLTEKISNWLEQKQLEAAPAPELADMMVSIEDLEQLLNKLPAKIFNSALQWSVADWNINKITSETELSTTQIYKLVESVKKFTSMDNLAEQELVDIETGIYHTLNLLESKIKSENAEIIVDIAKNLPEIYANSAALNQVWFSILDNALDAIPRSGQIRIRAGCKTDHIEVNFIDNGPGIPSDKINRIFDPFYTTKPPGQGTGLGLDLSRRIIRSHRGDIYVRSEEGRTEFCITLNIHKREK